VLRNHKGQVCFDTGVCLGALRGSNGRAWMMGPVDDGTSNCVCLNSGVCNNHKGQVFFLGGGSHMAFG
jgi:hypothetical protein